MYDDTTGVILAGGKSNRIGRDKALIKIGDFTAIEIVYQNLKPIFSEVIIIANEPQKFSFLNVKVYEDIFKDIGPLAGIHSGLVHSSNQYNFVISCDMVLMKKEIIDFIVSYKTDKPIVVPKVHEILQPMCAVYSKSCISIIEKMIQESLGFNKPNLNSPYRLIEKLDAEIIDMEKYFSNFPDAFLSMNDDADYKKVLKILNNQ